MGQELRADLVKAVSRAFGSFAQQSAKDRKTQYRWAENAAAARIQFCRIPHSVLSENGDKNDEK
jgi:hypothetical protein